MFLEGRSCLNCQKADQTTTDQHVVNHKSKAHFELMGDLYAEVGRSNTGREEMTSMEMFGIQFTDHCAFSDQIVESSKTENLCRNKCFIRTLGRENSITCASVETPADAYQILDQEEKQITTK